MIKITRFMRFLFIVVFFFTALTLPCFADESSLAETVYRNASKSIYEIYSINADDNNKWVYGSAVAVQKNLLATNCHVALGGNFIVIKVNNKPYLGRLFYYRQNKDLCLIEVVGVNLNPAHIRPTGTTRIGEQVFAIGNPLKFNQSISQGIISNKIDDDGKTVIQTDASISEGSSGGGLFDKSSNLIGITTASHKLNQGMTFAIPTELILEVLSPRDEKQIQKDDKLESAPVSTQVKYFYGTEISNKDRFNSKGQRLTKVREILRQDRANFYLGYTKDQYDEKERFFYTKEGREVFERAKIKISSQLAKKILGDDQTYITVFIISPNEIIVKEGLPDVRN